jgi:alkaline phosphatase
MQMAGLKSVAGLVAGAFLVSSAMLSPQVHAQGSPPRVVLLIGDGVGASYWTAAASVADELAVERFPVMGLVKTRSSDSKVTDSAAAGTALSTGVRTYDGAIGVDPDSNSVTTVLELAQGSGMATGLVATSSITHATPAAFASHVPDRNMGWEIARQLAEADVDVILGGGRRFFDPNTRPDSVDLHSDVTARYPYVETAAELANLKTNEIHKLFGLFAEDHMPAEPLRSPTLPEMTRAALEVLDHDPDGFFLMVEGSQPDWRGHDNEPLDAVVAEMLDFDRAVAVALEYQGSHPETLIVVVADHETGGLAIQQAGSGRLMTEAAGAIDSTVARLAEISGFADPELAILADSATGSMTRLSSLLRRRAREMGDSSVLVARYTTGGHTAQMVPLFASGPGAEQFGGIQENWRIGELLKAAVGR